MNTAGKLLVASPLLADPNFDRSVILVLTHDESGAVGVMLNRPSSSPVFDHLPSWSPDAADPGMVFIGGPVDPAVAIGLEQDEHAADPIPGLRVMDLGGPPEGRPVRIFSGYSGWGAGQLEAELAEGAWVVLDATTDDAFSSEPETLWARALRRQGGATAMLASYPPDLTLN